MSQPQTIRLTPKQLATILVFEAQIQAMQAGIQQLTWVGCTEAAEAMAKQQAAAVDAFTTLKRGWDTGLVIAAANAVIPNLERVNG
jgi:hypothetical protein